MHFYQCLVVFIFIKLLCNTVHCYNWLQHGFSSTRCGYNQYEMEISSSSFDSKTLSHDWDTAVSGASQSQPLFVEDVIIEGKKTGVLFMGTDTGTYYAIDVSTGSTIWKTDIGSYSESSCSSSSSSSTGVVDLMSSSLFVVSSDGNFYRLHLSSGAVYSANWPVKSIMNPSEYEVSGSLSIYLNTIYVPISARCEGTQPLEGKLLSFEINGDEIHSLSVPFSGGSIAGAGGASISSNVESPTIYLATRSLGTSSSLKSSSSGADAVVALTLGLAIEKTYSQNMMNELYDFVTTPVIINCTNGCQDLTVAAVNRAGKLYLMTSELNLLQKVQLVTSSAVSDGYSVSAPAFDSNRNQLILVTPQGEVMAISIDKDCYAKLTWRSYEDEDMHSSTYWTAPTIAGDVVYLASAAHGTVFALDAADGHLLWHSEETIGTVWSSPIVINGNLFVVDSGPSGNGDDSKIWKYSMGGETVGGEADFVEGTVAGDYYYSYASESGNDRASGVISNDFIIRVDDQNLNVVDIASIGTVPQGEHVRTSSTSGNNIQRVFSFVVADKLGTQSSYWFRVPVAGETSLNHGMMNAGVTWDTPAVTDAWRCSEDGLSQTALGTMDSSSWKSLPDRSLQVHYTGGELCASSADITNDFTATFSCSTSTEFSYDFSEISLCHYHVNVSSIKFCHTLNPTVLSSSSSVLGGTTNAAGAIAVGMTAGEPTGQPSGQPTGQPSGQPTGQPSGHPTGQPSRQPTAQPSSQPSAQPSGQPTAQPSVQPTAQPSGMPSGKPSGRPSSIPSSLTTSPSAQPALPTLEPTVISGSTQYAFNIEVTFKGLNNDNDNAYSGPTGDLVVIMRRALSDLTNVGEDMISFVSGAFVTDPTFSPTPSLTFAPTGVPSVRPPTGRPSESHVNKPTVNPSVSHFPTNLPSGRPTSSQSPTGFPTGIVLSDTIFQLNFRMVIIIQSLQVMDADAAYPILSDLLHSRNLLMEVRGQGNDINPDFTASHLSGIAVSLTIGEHYLFISDEPSYAPSFEPTFEPSTKVVTVGGISDLLCDLVASSGLQDSWTALCAQQGGQISVCSGSTSLVPQVTCDQSGTAVGLTLTNLNIFVTSTFSSAIQSLQSLQSLDIQNSKFLPDSTIPSVFRSLTGLTKLILQSDGIGDTLSSTVFDNLVLLKDLKLDRNVMFGTIPTSFSRLTDLSYLDLSNNKFSGTVPSLLCMPNLVYLELSGNPLSCYAPCVGNVHNNDFVGLLPACTGSPTSAPTTTAYPSLTPTTSAPTSDNICLNVLLMDKFGDGWDTAQLSVLPSRSRDVEQFFSPECGENQVLRTVCFTPSLNKYGDSLTLSIVGFEPAYPWEISWLVYNEFDKQTYAGGNQTTMKFVYRSYRVNGVTQMSVAMEGIQQRVQYPQPCVSCSVCDALESNSAESDSSSKPKPKMKPAATISPTLVPSPSPSLQPTEVVTTATEVVTKKRRKHGRNYDDDYEEEVADSIPGPDSAKLKPIQRDADLPYLRLPLEKPRSLLSREISQDEVVLTYSLSQIKSPWFDSEGFGVEYFLSSGSSELAAGTLCLDSSYSAWVVKAEKSGKIHLQQGHYTWRVTGGLDDDTSGITWTFCGTTGSTSTEMAFQVFNGKCSVIGFRNVHQVCSSSTSPIALMQDDVSLNEITINGMLRLHGVSPNTVLSEEEQAIVRSSLADEFVAAKVGVVSPDVISVQSSLQPFFAVGSVSSPSNRMLNDLPDDSLSHYVKFQMTLLTNHGLFKGKSDDDMALAESSLKSYVERSMASGLFLGRLRRVSSEQVDGDLRRITAVSLLDLQVSHRVVENIEDSAAASFAIIVTGLMGLLFGTLFLRYFYKRRQLTKKYSVLTQSDNVTLEL